VTRLANKVAVISGALGGMGRAACERFCAEGAAVVGVDRVDTGAAEFADSLRGQGHDFECLQADISSEQDVLDLAERVRESRGSIDVLYNNAGTNLGRPLAETTLDDWERLMSVNVTSVFLMTRAFAPLMTSGRGSVVNVSSVAAVVAFPDATAYSTSKAAVTMLTKTSAVDLAPAIRVNAICPGIIETPMPRAIAAATDDAAAMWTAFEEGAVLKRVGRPEEVVSLALYLASDEASFITGAVIMADGGWSLG
jgi:NAD(P)-dependent dehydrogenase (short-subunit alcohol dehydrogenase family)